VLGSGLPFLGAPLLVYVCTHTRIARVHFAWVGWLGCVISLIGAAFSTSINALIVTQGLLFGLSVLIIDNPNLLIVNTWFREHRGMAYGIVFGACDLCGVAFAFLANYLLHNVGQQKTFLVFAAIIFAIPGPCLFFLRERGATSVLRRSSLSSVTPKSAIFTDAPRDAEDEVILSSTGGNFNLIRRETPPTRKRFFQRPLFYLLSASNFFNALACTSPNYPLALPPEINTTPGSLPTPDLPPNLHLLPLAPLLQRRARPRPSQPRPNPRRADLRQALRPDLRPHFGDSHLHHRLPLHLPPLGLRRHRQHRPTPNNPIRTGLLHRRRGLRGAVGAHGLAVRRAGRHDGVFHHVCGSRGRRDRLGPAQRGVAGPD
jgi:hypothetical protein